jgi:beta-galactosidase
MKKLFLLSCLTALASVLCAEEMPDWQNPNMVQINRYPMTASFNTGGNHLSLNGEWDFKRNETIEDLALDFFKPEYDAAGWDVMPVPGMWELNGYGDPLYLNYGYA